MSTRHWYTLATLLAVSSLGMREAQAFCRTTTCDPADPAQHCARDDRTQCLTSGEPVFWASNCLTVSVQADGAPRAGIDYDEAKASVERAFAAWTNVDCGQGQRPSLEVVVQGPVECKASEYNKDHHNANVVWFRDDTWPYEGADDALGLTRVRFDLTEVPGELWDADIEVNAVSEPLSVGEPREGHVDLDSLLTHEAGHVLGLGHSLDIEASMIAGYVTGSDSLSTLGRDDVKGVCAMYPPGRDAASSSCEPRHGFSELCADAQPAEPDPAPAEGDEIEASSCAFRMPARHTRSFHGFCLVAFTLAAASAARRVARRRGIV
jgi:hypothetical protein